MDTEPTLYTNEWPFKLGCACCTEKIDPGESCVQLARHGTFICFTCVALSADIVATVVARAIAT